VSDEKAAEIARRQGAVYILPGMDIGSVRSPRLNQLLGFEDNDPSKFINYDKPRSAQASGIYAVPSHQLTNLEDGIAWIQDLKSSQIIVKPEKGVGGEDATYMPTKDVSFLRTELEKLMRGGRSFIIQP